MDFNNWFLKYLEWKSKILLW